MFKTGFLTNWTRSLFNPSGAAECMSKTPEEEAQELEKLMESETGGMPADPEEMQELLAKVRGKTNRKPPQFQAVTQAQKMFTMIPPNDGFQFSVGVPLSQRMQSQLKWNFSNKKTPELETMMVLVAGGASSMMDESEATMIQCQQISSGRLSLNSQFALPQQMKGTISVEMMGEDPGMQFGGLTLQKDFSDCHFHYMYQGVHMLSYMQTISKNLIGGIQCLLVPQRGMQFLFNYAGRYDFGKNSACFQYSPNAMQQQEKLLLGLIGRPSRNLNLFSELRVGSDSKTEMECGFRTRFPEWSVLGSITSTGRASTLYKRRFEVLEIQWQGQIHFAEPKKPACFGIGMSFGMGGGM